MKAKGHKMPTRRLTTLDTLHGQHSHLETRVATVEANLGAMSKNLADLTEDVRDLSQGVRAQGQQFEDQMKQLLVAVTQAQGPRKTDWHLLLGAVGLILAIGAAAFSPLMLRMGDLQTAQGRVEQQFYEHTQLPSHPVGQAQIEMLTHELEQNVGNLQKQIDSLRDYGSPPLRERIAVLEGKGCVVDKMAQLFRDEAAAIQHKP
jgi:hypothetical protein